MIEQYISEIVALAAVTVLGLIKRDLKKNGTVCNEHKGMCSNIASILKNVDSLFTKVNLAALDISFIKGKMDGIDEAAETTKQISNEFQTFREYVSDIIISRDTPKT